ncbi:MAG: 2-phosphosulfolactate phosphatase [Verrucomicrobiales bacterium]|jgi:2-phosphosulfolactate phosphatase|nr:2-phosphosulfolactate phosphatase [Verrucomicrobiales bacterium]
MPAAIQVCYAPADYERRPPAFWRGRAAVVFDILRATSTIVTALAAGCGGVRCFRAVAAARRYAARHARTALAGERDGVPPPAFQYGNSPREFLSWPPAYDTLALTTTNGTRAIAAAADGGAARVLIGSLLNLSALAEYCRRAGLPLTLVCSGTGADFSLEDALAAGALLAELRRAHPLVSLYRANRADLRRALHTSRNGRRLRAIGLAADLDFCLQRDRYHVVPALAVDGVIGI